mgnify:FL=1
MTDFREIIDIGFCDWISPKTGIVCDYNEDGVRDEGDFTNPLIADTDGGGTLDGLSLIHI